MDVGDGVVTSHRKKRGPDPGTDLLLGTQVPTHLMKSRGTQRRLPEGDFSQACGNRVSVMPSYEMGSFLHDTVLVWTLFQ